MSRVLLLWSQGRSHWWTFKDTVKGPERHTEKLEWKEEPRVLFCFVSGCGAIVMYGPVSDEVKLILY